MEYSTIDQVVRALREGASIDDQTVRRFAYPIRYSEVDPEWFDSEGRRWGWPGVTKADLPACYAALHDLRARLDELERPAREAVAERMAREPAPALCWRCHREEATDLDGGLCQSCFDNG